MEYAEIRAKVEAAFADRSLLADPAVKQAVLDTVAALDAGKLRVATCDEPGKWTTHAWIKQAVLLYFGVVSMEKMNVGPFEFFDKVPLKKNLDEAGVRTFVQGRASRWDLAQWVKLVRLMRRERVDILHTHLFGSNTLGRLLGRLAGVPVIISHDHWSTISPREALVDRMLHRLSNRVLVPSQASKT